ncbi:endoplasmic reticulum-derived transport vesicle ERV46 [Mycena galericulata]|nr:endoplasmic reticulum-derived transport vesicle ERV46 [Mycena galericulata]
MEKGLLAGPKGDDALEKTTDDVKVKTRTRILLTIVAAVIILAFTTMEFFDYRRVTIDTSVVVDKRWGEKSTMELFDYRLITIDTSVVVDKRWGEKSTMKLNISYPGVPCYLLSLDVVDINGETLRDVTYNIMKARTDAKGVRIPGQVSSELSNDVDKMTAVKDPNFCGSCYGSLELESGCCDTCEEVWTAYLNRGWNFNPDAIEQCKDEGWTEKLREKSNEGCNISGRINLNKVIGNIQISPGRWFKTNSRNVYELVPNLRDDGNFSHNIEYIGLEGDDDKAEAGRAMKERIWNPLDGTHASTSKSQYMFQFFLKVVSTQFRTPDGMVVTSNQYSTTPLEQLLKDTQGVYIVPGVDGKAGSSFRIGF